MHTPFPVTPRDVVPLTAHEFTGDVDVYGSPVLALVCRRFLNDENRPGLAHSVQGPQSVVRAVGFGLVVDRPRRRRAERVGSRGGLYLNEEWEFDAEAFSRAVDSAIARRSARSRE